MSTIKFIVPVEIEVDLEDWCTAYGMTEEVARRDAEEHSKGTIAEAIHEALERVANGSSLVGDLTSYLPEPTPRPLRDDDYTAEALDRVESDEKETESN